MADDPSDILIAARLLGRERGLIRRLVGFQRGRHREPETHDAAAERFVAQLGAERIAERAAELHRGIRQAFGYTRRQLALEVVEASAAIRGPHFALRLWIEQDPDDPTAWRLPLELGGFSAPEVVDDPRFLQAFSGELDRIELDLPQPVDVLDRVDALEADGRFERGLDYDPQGAWLQLVLPQRDLVLRLTPTRLELSQITEPDLARLIAGGREAIAALVAAGGGLIG